MQLHSLISQLQITRELGRGALDLEAAGLDHSFHLLDLVQGVVVGGHAGVVHLVEPHHHRVAGVGVLHNIMLTV